MNKNLSNKYGQKLLIVLKNLQQIRQKQHREEQLKKTVEATGNLISNKIADKITNFSKKSTKELQNKETGVDVERATPKKRYISPEERQPIIDGLRVV